MDKIKVEGTTWFKAGISEATQDAFVATHIPDEGTYSNLEPERKEQALRLVYATLFPVAPVVEPKKTAKAAITPSTAEGAE
jgi:hypothetical protein